jgi:hypothetical protein
VAGAVPAGPAAGPRGRPGRGVTGSAYFASMAGLDQVRCVVDAERWWGRPGDAQTLEVAVHAEQEAPVGVAATGPGAHCDVLSCFTARSRVNGRLATLFAKSTPVRPAVPAGDLRPLNRNRRRPWVRLLMPSHGLNTGPFSPFTSLYGQPRARCIPRGRRSRCELAQRLRLERCSPHSKKHRRAPGPARCGWADHRHGSRPAQFRFRHSGARHLRVIS